MDREKLKGGLAFYVPTLLFKSYAKLLGNKIFVHCSNTLPVDRHKVVVLPAVAAIGHNNETKVAVLVPEH